MLKDCKTLINFEGRLRLWWKCIISKMLRGCETHENFNLEIVYLKERFMVRPMKTEQKKDLSKYIFGKALNNIIR